VDRSDLAQGTSGRFHGLLHSGGRYVVKDPRAGEECIGENRILRHVAADCIEDTGGLFVTTPWDDPDYADRFAAGCAQTDVDCEEISIAQALSDEPRLNPRISRAFRVPDANIDVWKTVWAMGHGAQQRGARILPYHAAVAVNRQGDEVTGARVRDARTGEELEVQARVTVNATGAWAGPIADMAGVEGEGVHGLSSAVRGPQESDTETRDVTRAHTLLDHSERDGVGRFVTITGGKLTTFRLMAQDTMDTVCRQLGEHRPCTTHTEPLPGSERREHYLLGERLERKEANLADEQLICECEMIPRVKLEEAMTRTQSTNLDDIRRQLRLGMGPCQGGFCIYRATGIMHGLDGLTAEQADVALLDFLQERWKGVWPILYGDQLRQARLGDWIFQGVLDVEHLPWWGASCPTPRSSSVRVRRGSWPPPGWRRAAPESA